MESGTNSSRILSTWYVERRFRTSALCLPGGKKMAWCLLYLDLRHGLTGIVVQFSEMKGKANRVMVFSPAFRNSWPTGQDGQARDALARQQDLLRTAIAAGREAGIVARNGGPFGAVIADRNGHIVGKGSNQVVSRFDPTWHAEMEAIRNACSFLRVFKLDGCILYTSSAPCPMCLAAAYWAGLDGIVYAATVDDARAYGGFDDRYLYDQLKQPAGLRDLPQVQLLRDEALQVWKEYASLPDKVPY